MSGSTSVPVPSFGATGFVAPSAQEILNGVLADYNAAFGGNMNENLETPQGQLATSLTAIINDVYAQFVALTNNVDPATAVGRMQDGIARIYFITRNPALSTVVNALCTGIVGVNIPVGALALALDGNLYQCIPGGQIKLDGTVTLQFACISTGAIPCPAGSLNTIYRSIPGWDSITNIADGVLGNDVESRQAFELRRQAMVSQNAVGSVPAVQGAVLGVPGLLDSYTTDNSTSLNIVQDGVTILANSLYVCVSGGDPAAVARAIWTKKMPGCRMSGNTTQTVLDQNSGYSPPYPAYNITFQTAIPQEFIFNVRITNSTLVPSTVQTLIQTTILNAFAGIDGGSRARIGSTIYASRYYSGIALLGSWAEIISVKMGSTGAPKAVFAASITGSVMTVTGLSSGIIGLNQTVKGVGLADNLIIISFGTGSGGTGTYNLSIPQTISNQQMMSLLADQDVIQVGIGHVPVLDATDIAITLV